MSKLMFSFFIALAVFLSPSIAEAESSNKFFNPEFLGQVDKERVILSDDSAWLVKASHEKRLKNWKMYDKIVVANNPNYSEENPYPFRLHNTNRNTYAAAVYLGSRDILTHFIVFKIDSEQKVFWVWRMGGSSYGHKVFAHDPLFFDAISLNTPLIYGRFDDGRRLTTELIIIHLERGTYSFVDTVPTNIFGR
jgi:hypothetical protein